MESSSIRSRKRKQRPSESDPFGGIFTRSRSQIYFHRHRSGYARSDSNRIRNSTSKSLAKQEQVFEAMSQGSVKDLRARRVFSPSNDVVSIGELDLEQLDADLGENPKLLVSEADLGVSEPVVVDLKADSDNIVDSSLVNVQMTSMIVESGEKNEMGSDVNEVADIKGIMNNKSQTSVTSLRGRRKVFKSPTSFNYRRLLPYLMDSGSDDSSSFEIIEASLPNSLKSSNPVPNTTVALEDVEIGPVSNSSKLADSLMSDDKSCEKQSSNSVDAGLVSTVECSDVQKSQEDGLNDTLECEQMTPPDATIYTKSKTDDVSSGVIVKPMYKRALKSCSRQKLLQTPTSFSHRRLLPFLMSVAEDYSSPLKDDQSLKLEKAIDQNQQTPTQVLVQDEKSTTKDEASNSPTSTLVPVDASIDTTKSVTLVSNDNLLDANTPDKEGSGSSMDTTKSVTLVSNNNLLDSNMPDKDGSGSSIDTTKSVTLVSNDSLLHASTPDKEGGGSISQSEVTLQGEAVKFDGYIKMERSPPKVNLKCVEDATSKVAPLCIEQSNREDHLITVKESPISNATPLCIEQSYSEDRQITVKESPQQYPLQIHEAQGKNLRNGILKRTPRGCRGICNCLNCTSFRLHAERSFEFSKNQMHDAEEVALELINDLTCLRNLLETNNYSNSFDNDKEKQVKEACAKALYKEQEARARLAHMNEDLNVHCRSMNLMRPKVTFANKIEEKLIAKGQSYGKKSV